MGIVLNRWVWMKLCLQHISWNENESTNTGARIQLLHKWEKLARKFHLRITNTFESFQQKLARSSHLEAHVRVRCRHVIFYPNKCIMWRSMKHLCGFGMCDCVWDRISKNGRKTPVDRKLPTLYSAMWLKISKTIFSWHVSIKDKKKCVQIF